ncbi:hypothetical protein [Yersinia aleksiciae]|uniref:Uncharacterized protein n=1 Tax=Yersinia aleksiciae TaxID=263819 RepID=A0A0T9TEP4_YERAE|nr:hypothetical protein [Yersinia aleksiciae]AKP32314.1 hypothetical protein ACZ76_01470 [Yersinia aleksiciae]CFQ53276.1 Uncharacterised protein [Yersinia aleksiciae]CNK78023.1 Uncharacterised protein [Yersinia aleksiciae]
MARRTELAGIANGMIGSFNSRNNDVGGYWAIGQLKSYATINGFSKVMFNLILNESMPEIRLLNKVISNYSIKLSTLLKLQSIPTSWVQSATITIQFTGAAPTPKEVFRNSLGDFYRCTCDIVDDRGKCYIASDYGFCKPHSEHSELKRNDYIGILSSHGHKIRCSD